MTWKCLPDDIVKSERIVGAEMAAKSYRKGFLLQSYSRYPTRMGSLAIQQWCYLKGLPDLQSLSISDAKITDEGLESLKELTELRSISHLDWLFA